MIDLSTGEVPAPPATGNDILLDSYDKIRMQYVVFDTEPDVGDGKRGTMSDTLNVSDKSGLWP